MVSVTVAPGGAVAPLVLALGVDDEPVRGLVLLEEGARPVVDQRDRAELDLAGPVERVALDRGDRARPGSTRPRPAMSWKCDQVSSTPVGTVKRWVSSTRYAPAAASTARRVSTVRQVAPVVGVAVEVRRRVGAVGGPRGGGAHGLVGRGLARERRLDGAGPQRGRPHVGEPDPGLADRAALDPHGGGDRDDRPLVGDPDELLVVRAPPGVLGDPHLGEDLVLADRGLEEVDEEVVGRDGPGPARARRSRTRPPARAPAPRGHRPGRRARARRRRCRGAGPGRRRGARPPW